MSVAIANSEKIAFVSSHLIDHCLFPHCKWLLVGQRRQKEEDAGEGKVASQSYCWGPRCHHLTQGTRTESRVFRKLDPAKNLILNFLDSLGLLVSLCVNIDKEIIFVVINFWKIEWKKRVLELEM